MTRSLLLLLAGGLVGAMLSQPRAAAEVRRETPQQAFSSGAMRSETVLREIAGILRKIDARVARLEVSVTRLSVEAIGK